jgi:lipopolysaccharide cholinephosphotransferase
MSDKYVLNEEETRKMHNIQLEMMIELDKICRKHNIKYILEGGSLLGAVRHKGFIPWDNDMDVRMLRPDYERFCEIIKNFHREYFFRVIIRIQDIPGCMAN